MAEQVFDFEVSTVGTQVTTASTIGASSVTTTGGTVKIDNSCVGNGTRNLLMTVTTANTVTISRFTLTTSMVRTFGGWFTTPTTPTTNLTIVAPRYSGGPVFRVNWGTNNSLTTGDFAGATANPLTIVGAGGLTPGARYYLAWQATVDTATTGLLALQVYDATGTLIGSASSTSYNLGTTAISAMDLGVISTNPAGRSVAWDYVQTDTTTTPYVPAGAAVPATVNPPTGTTVRAGVTAAVSAAAALTAPTATSARAGTAPSVRAGATVAPPPAATTRTGVAATLAVGAVIIPQVGARARSGTAPTISAGVILTPPAGARAFIGGTATVLAGSAVTVTPPVAAVTRAGVAPTVHASVSIAPPAGARQRAGQAPSLMAAATIAAPTAQALLAGVAPTIIYRPARDITVTVTGPHGNPITVTEPHGHPFGDSTPRSNPLRVTGATR